MNYKIKGTYRLGLIVFIYTDEEHNVVFKPEKNQLNSEKISPVVGALYAEPGAWNTSLTSQLWVAVHSINGLGPVRPVVVISSTFELDGMKAVELKKA